MNDDLQRTGTVACEAVMRTPFPTRQDGKLGVEEYLAFIDTRPGHERWQLIDGVAMLMPQPTIRHQCIASNLCHVLTEHFRARRLDLLAIFRIGLIVPGAELFRPFGDVVVADGCAGETYTAFVDTFYLVAEVLSDGDMEKDMPAKALHYIRHPQNLYFLLIEQRQVRVEVRARAAGWEPVVLEGLDAVLELPGWGFSATLAGLYRGTSLAQAA
jgi:Uma2 family endonuclease